MTEPRTAAGRALLDKWMAGVVAAWRYWEGRDHRYGRDFAAFVGERLMTDFNLRDQEPYPFAHAEEYRAALAELPIEAEAAELAGGLDAEDWAAIENCLSACANDPLEPQRYSEWYAEVLAKVRAYRHPVVISPGQDETPRTGEHSS